MNCSAVREVLHQWPADEPLAPEVRRHIESCSPCAEFVAELRTFDERIRGAVLSDSLNTLSLERRVIEQIGEEHRHRQRRLWTWAMAGGLAAAGIVSAVLGIRVVRQPSLPELASRDHMVEVVNHQPRRWRADLASATELGANQEAPAALISVVTRAGYTFKQAKICRLGGLPFLHVVYSDGKQDFSLFLRRGDGGKVSGARHTSASGKPIFTCDHNAQHVASFTNGDLKALVVTSEPGDAALQIAQSAAQVL